MIRSATLSPCGAYRYTLTREWDPSLPRALFVMLNPSTADAEVDDPTIRRCIGFARRDGFGSIEVVNLFAFRATDPRELWRAGMGWVSIVGPDNDRHVSEAVKRAVQHVAAWGADPPGARSRGLHHWRALWTSDITRRAGGLHCLGVTKDGRPRHPLYVRGDASLIPWVTQ